MAAIYCRIKARKLYNNNKCYIFHKVILALQFVCINFCGEAVMQPIPIKFS